MSEIPEYIREALSRPFCVLYLDGRNEHGSHVPSSFPRSFDINDDDLSEQADAILTKAEWLGFEEGDHIWVEFNWVDPQIGDEGRVELDGYYDFTRINVEMSIALFSHSKPLDELGELDGQLLASEPSEIGVSA